MECKQDFLAPAGTVILFDTSGIHRQAIPVLEPRQAFFFNYHDPSFPIMPEETEYYRYHPLMLNAAFLGGLSAEDCRVLGFGNKTNYQAGNVRPSPYPRLQSVLQSITRLICTRTSSANESLRVFAVWSAPSKALYVPLAA